MNKKNLVFFLLLLPFLAIHCRKQSDTTHLPTGRLNTDSASNWLVLADTITYTVVIRNPNPDDKWTEKCLSRLNADALIDSLFALVYSDRAKALDATSLKPIPPDSLKQLEKLTGFGRNEIGMVMFTEKWLYMPNTGYIAKEVMYVVPGYNYYTAEGEHFGYKPLMRIVLPPFAD